jgi:hypothetical protein
MVNNLSQTGSGFKNFAQKNLNKSTNEIRPQNFNLGSKQN